MGLHGRGGGYRPSCMGEGVDIGLAAWERGWI